MNSSSNPIHHHGERFLSIVEIQKDFRNICLGQQIKVYADYANIIKKYFNSERVMRWRFFLEINSLHLRYIKGHNNLVADTLSRLAKQFTPLDESHKRFYSLIKFYVKEHRRMNPIITSFHCHLYAC
jgi:hypothetical protein